MRSTFVTAMASNDPNILLLRSATTVKHIPAKSQAEYSVTLQQWCIVGIQTGVSRTFHVDVDKLCQHEGHAPGWGPGHRRIQHWNDRLPQQVCQTQLTVTVVGHDVLGRHTRYDHLHQQTTPKSASTFALII